MKGITVAMTIKMEDEEASLSVQAKQSHCEPMQETLFSFGENLSTIAARKASTARCSETKANTYQASLSDRLTKSLITSGLVAGITPMYVRKTLGLPILDFALLPLDGENAE